MQMKMFLALRSAGVAEAEARSVADAVRDEVKSAVQDLREDLATKGDVQRSESKLAAELERRLGDHLKWTIVIVFGGFGLFGTIVALSKAL
ncbi:MAG: hypothetical protein J7598_21040 [Mitsuaria chitosanitabida]|uniref:hypothetical protein n=1 Tax=Roseateles chitosanitabidus TaxID=65048 RepID=UPI001B2DC0A3|nr:hypothetical protein [Roseateles chitosanitabidus]MBO9689097.1 hypothetical protein [Roseateles chitosanitabidus]